MTDVDIFKLLKEGFILWKNNPRICIPFVWSTLLTVIIGLTIFFTIFFNIFMPIIGAYLTNPMQVASSDFLNEILQPIKNMLLPIILGVVVLITSAVFIYSFFTAGAIGMIKELLQTGETNTSTMWSYGKRKMLSVLGANVIIGLIAAVGFVFIIPGFFVFISSFSSYSSTGVMSSSTSFGFLGGILFFLLGLLLMIIYIACISIIFALVPYAVVIDDLHAVNGVKKGFHIFWHGNKINVFAMWIIIAILGVPIGLIQRIPLVGWLIYLILIMIIWTPLVTVWWSKFYLIIKNHG